MKKFLTVFAAAAITAAALTACGGNKAEETTKAPAAETTAEAAGEASGEAEETETEAESTEAASGELKTITVGASPAPHAEILEAAKDVLKEKGYDLEIVEYTDQP